MKYKKNYPFYEFKRAPLFRRCVIEQFPFIAEDFDAMTTYELLCKVVQYLNFVIKNVNEQGEELEKLKKAFDDLYKFINEWFDNLDLQDEVDDYLDRLAQSGVLADILHNYIDIVSQAEYLKNRINNGFPEIDGSPLTVSVRNDFVDEVIPYYELKIYKKYQDCAIFEPDATAPREKVINAGDMRSYARSMMEYQYNNDDVFIASNGGLPGWYLFSDGTKVCSDLESVHELQGWFYLVKRKDTGALDWIENGNNHDGSELDASLYEWGLPIWSPVRVEGINVCTDNFANYASYNNIVNNRHPRTLLCIDDNDEPSIIIIPGRSCYSCGMTYAEMMHLPQRFKHIFNFDGGGSSVLLCSNVSMCPSWHYTLNDWRHNVSIFKITPNAEGGV